MNKTARQYGVPSVVFPHWVHRVQFTCQVCHPGIFRMEAGAHDILMERMAARGTFCLACHNGKIVWKPVNCSRCHVGETGQAKENRDPEAFVKNFPRDPGGNIDWTEAIKQGLIAPRSSLTGKKSERPPVPSDTLMPRTDTLPAVVFPHASHALWLNCGNCHPAPFVAKKQANQISMEKIWAGEYCGKCHGKVAFPITACSRCHQGNSSP